MNAELEILTEGLVELGEVVLVLRNLTESRFSESTIPLMTIPLT
jgi:hypothetical protein